MEQSLQGENQSKYGDSIAPYFKRFEGSNILR